jgi:hypothetical protein
MVKKSSKVIVKNGGVGGFWFLGFIGTLFYYERFHASSFGLVLIGILKAIVWPAILIYHLLVFLKV